MTDEKIKKAVYYITDSDDMKDVENFINTVELVNIRCFDTAQLSDGIWVVYYKDEPHFVQKYCSECGTEIIW